jgi:membrane protein EpsK
LVGAAGNVIRPVILIKYAQGDYVGLQRLAGQSVKLLGLALSLPVGLLCGFSSPILVIWLGPTFEYLNILLIVIVFHLSLNLSVRPLLHVQNAYNRVRWPGIVTLLSGLGSLAMAILLAKWGKWGAAGVAMAVAVAWTAKNAVYMPIYTARIMKLRWWTFFPSLVASIVGTLCVGVASYSLTLAGMPNRWPTLAGSALLVSFFYVFAVWVIGLSHRDKRLLKNLNPLPAKELGQAF